MKRILGVNLPLQTRKLAALRALLLLAGFLLGLFAVAGQLDCAQQVHTPPGKGGIAELSASGPQQRQGDLYIADGDVNIRYDEFRLRADHVEYNNKTFEATARGHVQFDYENQHVDADEAQFNVRTGHGTFHNVRGTVKIDRRANPAVLVTENPLYFEAREVERLSSEVYVVHHAWVTICDPEKPKWQFYAPQAHIQLGKSVALLNANFRLFKVPLIWMPYATAPAGRTIRQSGFLIPTIGHSNTKGLILGDAFYWAPRPRIDTTLGASYLSLRGWAIRGELRAKPTENTSLLYSYYGVNDRGLPNAQGVLQPQGGEQQRFEMESLLPHNWRFVTDANQLSSLTFRLAFADTYGEAINSEVPSAIFLTNNFRGFSVNFAALNDLSFLTTNPQTSVTLGNAPEGRFSSVEQAPWKKLPFYFSFDAFAGAVHREDPIIDTPGAVPRAEFAPRVTVPLHWGPWLGVTASAAFRTTWYGDSFNAAGQVSSQSISRNTGEFTVDLRPPALQRFFDRPASKRKYKHTIEPLITYRFVTGVNNFARFIRYDADATLTDTNEVEYGIVQRLYRKQGDAQPEEFLSWSVLQKHYFDTTFNGAIVNGQRNVFQALDSVTPFAFALGPRNWSPIVSDFKITPGGRYDIEQILEYDPQFGRITVLGTLAKIRPYREFYAIVAHFHLNADALLQPISNQVRALIGYGSIDRKGFNAAAGLSYDITHGNLQNQLVMLNYNGGCCGIALEYRHIAPGQVQTENQFRVAFIIANIGNFGNLRRQDRIF